MKRFHTGLGGLALAALCLSALGCPKDKPADTTAAPGTNAGGTGQDIKVAVIPKGTSASFWQTMKAGAEKAGTEEKITVVWQGPDTENDATSQINMLRNQATKGVSGVVIAAQISDALDGPVQEVVKKGIPVVTVDSGISSDTQFASCYVATDNTEGGRKAAKALAEAMGDKGNVGVLIFHQGSASSDEREKGFKEEIAKHPGIHIVTQLETNDAAEALGKTTSMLTAHSDITGIFAANEPTGIGAANYIRQNKKSGKIKLVAFDSASEEIAALNDGVADALIVQDPFQMGYLGVKNVVQVIRTKKPLAVKKVDSGVTVVTKANLQTPEVQKLLDPTKR